MRRGFRWSLLLGMALLGVAGLTPARSEQRGAGAHVSRANGPSPKVVTDLLRTRGFRVNPGYPMLWGQGACAKYLYPALQTCLGNNPVSPYVMAVVKAWPNEHVGPSPPNTFGQVRRGFTPFYRLSPREAIVIYGKMPPPGKFMGWQAFVWSQPGHWTAKDYNRWARTPNRPYPMQYLFATIPAGDPKAKRTMSWSSFGDSVNNVVMQRRSGDPWGRYRYFVITPSATTDRAVRSALRALGVSNRNVFTEPIPRRDALGTIGPLGLGKNAIDFYTFFRYALPADPTAAQKWWADVPLTVMRVRAPASLGPVRRYAKAKYGKRTARSEEYLAGDMERLLTAVCSEVTSTAQLQSPDCAQPPPASSRVPDPADDYGWNAAYCRKVHMWCGDISDAGLLWTGPLPLDGGQVYAMVDTLATETGNATYVGLGVNDASTFLSPTGVTDATLKGSADRYGPLVGHPDKFYVHYFTRTCDRLGPMLGARLKLDCTEISPDMVPPMGGSAAFGHPALRGAFWPGLRDYIAPGTAHGPDTSKLLRPRILTFS